LLHDKEHLDPSKDEKRAEDVDEPAKLANELGTHDNHHTAHQQRAKDSPKQHPMLIHRRDRQESKDHGDHENVVHRQRLFDHIPGQVFHRGGSAVVDPLRVAAADRHQVNNGCAVAFRRKPQAHPVVLITGIDKSAKGQAEGNPNGRPA
jgi:hypothetical protein